MMSKNKKGAALVEYGVLVGLISVLSITAVLKLGTTVDDTFNTVSGKMSDVNTGAAFTEVAESATGSGSFANPLAPTQPASCQTIASGAGQVDAQADYPGTFCFEFADNSTPAEYDFNDGSYLYGETVFADYDNDYTFVAGATGMDFESGTGDDDAFYSLPACVRSFPIMGSGANEVIVLNHASTDAYFSEMFGNQAIDFADGSGISATGNITQIHFTDTTLNASQIAARNGSDSMPPDAGCPGGSGPSMG